MLSAHIGHCADGVHHLSLSDDTQFQNSKTYQNIHETDRYSVSSWEAHLRIVQPCNTASLRELTEGKWYITEDGHYLYEPNSCALKRLTGHQARRYENAYTRASCFGPSCRS